VVGGVAAVLHGSSRFTQDLDVVYDRSPDNADRIAAALGSLHPRLRGAPEGLPFRLDARTILAGLNFTLSTDAGAIDLLGEVAGGGTYPSLLPSAREIRSGDLAVLCVDLPTLIRLKRAAGRPKDLEAIAELEALGDEGAAPPDGRS
jgi:hypothetical protein